MNHLQFKQVYFVEHLTQYPKKALDNILDVPAHFYGYEPKSVKSYDTAISQTEGIWSLLNPPFKTRPLLGSMHPLSYNLIHWGRFFHCQPYYRHTDTIAIDTIG